MAKGIISQFLGISEDAEVQEIPLEDIQVNPHQPREIFDEEKLQELSSSISEVGLIQPIIVRKRGKKFELVVGERRWRAAKMAGKKRIPAIVRKLSNDESIRMALIENLQRENLNPIEEARAYAYLRDNLSLSQQEIARCVGKSQPLVSNVFKLLRLPQGIQKMVAEGKINQGQARALLKVRDFDKQQELALRLAENEFISISQLRDYIDEEEEKASGDEPETEPKESAGEDKEKKTPAREKPRQLTFSDFQSALDGFRQKGLEVVSEERREDDDYVTLTITVRAPKRKS